MVVLKPAAGAGTTQKKARSKYTVPAQATVLSAMCVVAYIAVGIGLSAAKVDWALGARVTIAVSAFLTATRYARTVLGHLQIYGICALLGTTSHKRTRHKNSRICKLVSQSERKTICN